MAINNNKTKSIPKNVYNFNNKQQQQQQNHANA